MIEKHKLQDFKGGWVAGDFLPTLVPTKDFEVACKSYKSGEREDRHYHAVATEITVVTSGDVMMNGTAYSAGDVLVIPPGTSTDFRALSPVLTTVVKYPSVAGDKFKGHGPGESTVMKRTLILQGPAAPDCVEKYVKAYSGFFDSIILSTYTDPKVKVEAGSLKVVLSKPEAVGKYNFQNIYLQMLSTLNGLMAAEDGYCLKVRADEFYSNLDKLPYNPSKFQTNNVFFSPNIKCHASDHMIGMPRETFISVCKNIMARCSVTGYKPEAKGGLPQCAEQLIFREYLNVCGLSEEHSWKELIRRYIDISYIEDHEPLRIVYNGAKLAWNTAAAWYAHPVVAKDPRGVQTKRKLLLISHRGNLVGADPSRDNNPVAIKDVLSKGLHCEVDVRMVGDTLWLGHDAPTHKVDISFLKNPSIIAHAKDGQTLRYLLDSGVHSFWHDKDPFTLTSAGLIWAYPGQEIDGTVCVLPETTGRTSAELLELGCVGVCSDNIMSFNGKL